MKIANKIIKVDKKAKRVYNCLKEFDILKNVKEGSIKNQDDWHYFLGLLFDGVYNDKDYYIELNRMLNECSEFIRSIWVHTEGEDMGDYNILRNGVNQLSDKVNAMIIKLDAYEQNKNQS